MPMKIEQKKYRMPLCPYLMIGNRRVLIHLDAYCVPQSLQWPRPGASDRLAWRDLSDEWPYWEEMGQEAIRTRMPYFEYSDGSRDYLHDATTVESGYIEDTNVLEGRYFLPGGAIVEITTDDADTPAIRFTIVGTGLPNDGPAPSIGNDFVGIRLPLDPVAQPVWLTSDAQGQYPLVIPPDTAYEVVTFDLESGLVAHDQDVSPSEGQPLTPFNPVFVASTQPDSDGDGLPDDIEFAAHLDPNNPDTDGDGMPDKWEVELGLDPLKNDALLDRNGDGISNLQEYLDSLKDRDSDHDGLPDWWEQKYFPGSGNADPAADADGDGWNNLKEYQMGTDPNNPSDGINAIEQARAKIRLHWEMVMKVPLIFSGEAGSKKDLEEMANALNTLSGKFIEVK